MSRSRLGLEAERLESRLGLGHEGLVSIPGLQAQIYIFTESQFSNYLYYMQKCINFCTQIFFNGLFSTSLGYY